MSSKKQKHSETMDEDENYAVESSSGSDDEEDCPHPEAYTGNEEVQVDFEGRSPTDPDREGIAQLLSRLFLKAHINCKEMADLIIAQNYVGSVICQCESDCADSETDDDMCEEGTIFGITTALNLTAKKEKPCIEQLRAYLLKRAETHANDAVLKHFRSVLGSDERSVGFLINERFINIPAQISVPLLKSLQMEIENAKQKKMKFDFVYFLMIIKLYRKEARKGKPAEDTYTNAEEEIFVEQAVSSFEYSVANETDSGMSGDWLEGDAALTPYRKVLLFDATQLPQIVTDVEKLING